MVVVGRARAAEEEEEEDGGGRMKMDVRIKAGLRWTYADEDGTTDSFCATSRAEPPGWLAAV